MSALSSRRTTYLLISSSTRISLLYSFSIAQQELELGKKSVCDVRSGWDLSGCCKPPSACGYNYVNPILWINPVNPMVDPDCYLWTNDQNQLCYNCNACKAGLLGNIREEWRKANIFLMVAVVVLIWVYLIACSAFKNAQTENLFRHYKGGWV
ncbi:hypothetical protein ACSQ67_009539 [Phaseolus vulgaris]